MCSTPDLMTNGSCSMKDISSDSKCLFHLLFLLLAVCLLHFTLHSPFVLDDSQILEYNITVISKVSWESLQKIVSEGINNSNIQITNPTCSKTWKKNNNPDRVILYLKQAVKFEPDRVESHRNLLPGHMA